MGYIVTFLCMHQVYFEYTMPALPAPSFYPCLYTPLYDHCPSVVLLTLSQAFTKSFCPDSLLSPAGPLWLGQWFQEDQASW